MFCLMIYFIPEVFKLVIFRVCLASVYFSISNSIKFCLASKHFTFYFHQNTGRTNIISFISGKSEMYFPVYTEQYFWDIWHEMWKQQWKLCDILRLTLLIKYFMRIFWSDTAADKTVYCLAVCWPSDVLTGTDTETAPSCPPQYSPPLHTRLHTPHQSHCWPLTETGYCKTPSSAGGKAAAFTAV